LRRNWGAMSHSGNSQQSPLPLGQEGGSRQPPALHNVAVDVCQEDGVPADRLRLDRGPLSVNAGWCASSKTNTQQVKFIKMEFQLCRTINEKSLKCHVRETPRARWARPNSGPNSHDISKRGQHASQHPLIAIAAPRKTQWSGPPGSPGCTLCRAPSI
jgi:hypothetical protein